MTETASPPDAASSAQPGSPQPIGGRRRLWRDAGVAAVAALLGAAGAVLALRGVGATADTHAVAPAAAPSPASTTADPMAGMDMSGAAPPPSGATAVYLSPARQQLIGVRTAAIETRSLDATIRTVGTLAYDETRVTEVHPKVSGWVERVYVDFVGKSVRSGQPLLTLYSPDLVATQNEYLLALKAERQLGQSAFPETRAGAESLVAATRERLRLWDISDAQVATLAQTGVPQRTLTLYSPFDGVVLERNTFAGQYITPETSTAKIVDLSTIWAIAQLFEYEARMVKLGDSAVSLWAVDSAADGARDVRVSRH